MRKIESSGNTDRATLVELPRGGQVASERLFDNDARMLGQVRGAESFDHRLEERGRDSEVVRRAPSAAQRLFYRRERVRIFIIPAHILEQGQKMVEGTLVIDPARALDAVRHAFVQTRQTPLREGDADYRDLEGAAFHHRIERREDHLVGEIARHTEEHQRVRTGGGHQSLLSWRASFPQRVPDGFQDAPTTSY